MVQYLQEGDPEVAPYCHIKVFDQRVCLASPEANKCKNLILGLMQPLLMQLASMQVGASGGTIPVGVPQGCLISR